MLTIILASWIKADDDIQPKLEQCLVVLAEQNREGMEHEPLVVIENFMDTGVLKTEECLQASRFVNRLATTE